MNTIRKHHPHHILFALLLILVLSAAFHNPNRISLAQSGAGPQVYWGAWIDGEQYGLGDAPWIDQTIDTFENHVGKRISILHWGQAWHWAGQSGYPGIGDGKFQMFETGNFEKIRQRGTLPMINWNSWELSNQGTNNPEWQLVDIINGNYDPYITKWAQDAKAWGKPFFLRFNHEMNGNWYPWSEQVNGNRPGEYAQAWRHVHDIFVREGATNVTWVWSVNVEYPSNPESSNLENYYPGDGYVDWVAIDGYNWGTNPARNDVWKTFSQVFSQTYNHLLQVAPSKPIMISEFASTEYGGSKPDWITDALVTQIPVNFPQIKAILYFNRNDDGMDWIIETSQSAQNAFAAGIASSYYSAADFASLSSSPITPLSSLPSAPTPTSDPVVTPTPLPSPTEVPPTPLPSPTPTPTSPSPSDSVPPAVSLTSPSDGAQLVNKSTVQIEANATDDVGVAKVDFYVANRLLCTDSEVPYTCSWSIRGRKNTTYTLNATAYDLSGNSASSQVTVTVK